MERRGSRRSRREFVVGAGVGLLAGCGSLPFPQPPPTAVKVHRLGFMFGSAAAGQTRAVNRFHEALGELGYVEGQNLVIEYRWGDGSDTRLVEAAAELARIPVDIFVVPAVPVARIARQATTTIPIVLAGVGDPLTDGLAASYARPGGTVTRVTTLEPQLFGKRLQLLKEAAPSISRVAIFWEPLVRTPIPPASTSMPILPPASTRVPFPPPTGLGPAPR